MLEPVWLEVWKSEGIEDNLVFPHGVCLGVEKCRDRKLFCSVEKINKMIGNKVCVNLLLCPY